MKEIQLTQGKIALVDDEDFKRVSAFHWRSAKDGSRWYAIRAGYPPFGPTVRMHRELMGAPEGAQVDHVNGNGLDNRRSNLRICSNTENSRNRRKRAGTSSRYKGVTWRKRARKWLASIYILGRQVDLGLFPTEELAADAYNEAAIAHFGEFALLNNTAAYQGA